MHPSKTNTPSSIPDPYKLVPVSQFRIQASIELKKRTKGCKREKINRNIDWKLFQIDEINEDSLDDIYITERSNEESQIDKSIVSFRSQNKENQDRQGKREKDKGKKENIKHPQRNNSNISINSQVLAQSDSHSNQSKPVFKNPMQNTDRAKLSKFQNNQISKPVELDVPKKIKQSIEDARVSNYYFRKFITVEYIAVLLTILSFFINLVYTEAADGKELDLALHATTVLTFTLIGTIIARYYFLLELLRIQQVLRFSGNFFKKLYKSQNLIPMILEIGIIFIHPNVLFNDIELYQMQAFTLFTIKHQTNDILALFVLLRLYIILRGMVSETSFYSPRASRLCRMNTCDHNIMFSIKCILKQYPLRALIVLFVTFLFIFGHGVKLTESPLSDVQYPIEMDFTSYLNCFWCIIVTMGTIGYGDYYPRTIPGRVVIFLTSICGVLLSSLLIVALSAYLNETTEERKAHICIKRLELRKELDVEVSKVMIAVTKLAQMKKGTENKLNSNEEKKNVDSVLTELKQRISNAKNKQRQIKSLVDNNNLYQQMQRYFTILKTNFNEIYRRQVNIKNFLLQIAKISTTEELNVISFAKTLQQKALQK